MEGVSLEQDVENEEDLEIENEEEGEDNDEEEEQNQVNIDGNDADDLGLQEANEEKEERVINVVTDEPQEKNDGENMFEAQFSDGNSDRKVDRTSDRRSIEKGLEDGIERTLIQKEDDAGSQDSLAEYERLISEKLEQK